MSRCYGCHQDNCGYSYCDCSCHGAGYKDVRGEGSVELSCAAYTDEQLQQELKRREQRRAGDKEKTIKVLRNEIAEAEARSRALTEGEETQ